MAIVFTQIYQGVLTTSAASLYAATNKRAVVQKATAFNTTGGAVTFDLYIVPASGTASDTNKIVEGKSVAAGATLIVSDLEGHVIPAFASLQGLAGSNTAITLTVSGLEITS